MAYIALLANISTQSVSLLHRLEQAAGGIGLHVNADKTEYMYINQKGDICILNGSLQKLMNKFTYFGSSILSTENDFNMRRAKTWNAIDRLSVIWESDLSDKIKLFLLSNGCVSSTIWMYHMDAH